MATMNNPKRYRLTVPEQDTSVQRWLSEQLNMSASIRQLIRDDIEKNGYSDVTCRMVEQGAKRGRPSNAELARREQESMNNQLQESVPVVSEVPVAMPVQVQPETKPEPQKVSVYEQVSVQQKPEPVPEQTFGSQPNPMLMSMLGM